MPVAREAFSSKETLCSRWRDPRRVTKALTNDGYQVQDLTNDNISDAHATPLHFYRDALLNERAILPHVLSSETGMQVAQFLLLKLQGKTILVAVCWKELKSFDALKPIA